MDAIGSIVQTALFIVASIAVVIGAGAGIFIYYTASGQEEGE